MKTLLAILLSFLVTEAPVLAIHGGYTLGGSAQVIGTYAGIMIPIAVTQITGTVATSSTTSAAVGSFGSNSLGIFTLGIPQTGLGNGQILIFSEAQGEDGTITALADPVNIGNIVGVIQVTGSVPVASDNFFGFNVTASQVTGQGAGALEVSTTTSANSASPTGIDLNGTASMTFSTGVTNTAGATRFTQTQMVIYQVEGFQQLGQDVIASGS